MVFTKKTTRLLALLMAAVMVLCTGCGTEKPPLYTLPTKPAGTSATEAQKPAETVWPSADTYEYNGNSKALDLTPYTDECGNRYDFGFGLDFGGHPLKD